jgi:hypothetical protein
MHPESMFLVIKFAEQWDLQWTSFCLYTNQHEYILFCVVFLNAFMPTRTQVKQYHTILFCLET